ncbi:MAG: bifunctional 1-(5-phosphoribosyl)-5-((5-phosphoribosylamino)methylideneamino)imidazole-4-carboxamide isomerase/phosphoribosylanthranilate isomerase PriA, partial [Verrucomicrobia bacterium]|nr:bifunctional 1-(5-phosphoribosyl)-5-((5-phosphoribosylamino)methylideneamino)imidazole-4-carboxamide isomerase/phosphoribosylanthranilate isomerase PriA [Verrucomicrobiota bacterium]
LDELLAAVNCDIIASGGVTTAGDVRALAQRPRLHGAIIGRALYEGTLTLRAARNALG